MRTILFSIAIAAQFSTSAVAGEIPGSQTVLRGSEVGVVLGADYRGITLTIAGPDGFYAKAYSKGNSASIDLIKAGGTKSGHFTYEVTAASPETTTDANPMDNGRGGVDSGDRPVSVSMSGGFFAENGLIADKSGQSEQEN